MTSRSTWYKGLGRKKHEIINNCGNGGMRVRELGEADIMDGGRVKRSDLVMSTPVTNPAHKYISIGGIMSPRNLLL